MCSEGLARLSRRVWRRFVHGSREISLLPSLHRASTDALMWDCMHMEEVCNKVILILFCSPPSQETCQYLVVLH